MRHVPFLDLGALHREIRPALDEAWRRVADSGWFVLGPEVEAFEAEFAAFCGVRFCVGVGNGLEALHLLLLARGPEVGPGQPARQVRELRDELGLPPDVVLSPARQAPLDQSVFYGQELLLEGVGLRPHRRGLSALEQRRERLELGPHDLDAVDHVGRRLEVLPDVAKQGELRLDVRPPGADRHPDADLPGALGHGHEHDVHDADAADEQRDADDAAHHDRDGVQDSLDGLLKLLGRLDAEIVLVVFPQVVRVAQEPRDRRADGVELAQVPDRQPDEYVALALIALQARERVERNDEQVVLALAEDLALLLE